MSVKVLSKKIHAKFGWFEIVNMKIKLPNGKIVNWLSPKFPDAVAVVPIDLKKKIIYLVKEYRPGYNRFVLQVPGGVAEGKTKKQIQASALKELREETGLNARRFEKLTSVIPFGRGFNRWHFYLATDLYKDPLKRDVGEQTIVVKMPLKKAYKTFLKQTVHFNALLGLLLAKEKLKLKI